MYSFNSLHMHQYNVGLLTAAQMLAFCPKENSTTLAAALATHKALHG